MWLDTQDARNPSNFTLDCVSDHSGTKRTTLAKGIFKVFLFLETAASFVYIFDTLSATRVLNSFEELCITLAADGNSFARELNPHGGAYIVIHRQTVSFYQNSSVWLDTQDARSRDRNPSNFTLDCVSDHLYIYIYIYMYTRVCVCVWERERERERERECVCVCVCDYIEHTLCFYQFYRWFVHGFAWIVWLMHGMN